MIHQIPVGQMQNFTYVIADDDTRSGIVIDPSWNIELVSSVIKKHNINIELIINTHHHFDHTTGNAEMARITGAPIVQHENSELEHDRVLRDGDTVKYGASSLRVLHTPGHSRDSICLVDDKKIISGDTLFVGSCGRVDLPGGSAEELYGSLYDVICGLDDSLEVYPGHDYGETSTSTISHEKRTNPVLQARSRSEFVGMFGG